MRIRLKSGKSIAMKKIIQMATIVAGLLIVRLVPAQVSVHVNIGVQPLWGPVGYDYVERSEDVV